MRPINFILFALTWFIVLYLLNSAIAGRFKHVEPRKAMLYFFTVALIGLYGEIFLDTIYNHFVGRPLWRYNILPIYSGYTSSYAIMTWGLYGFHLYLLHNTLGSKWSITRTKHLALIFSVEALVLEAALTISALFFFGKYMYYYYPPDLWHVSTVQNIPFYFICGLIILKTMKRFRRDPVFFSAMSAALLFVLVFLI